MIESWKDMPLRVYKQVMKAGELEYDEDRPFKYVAALTDRTLDEVLNAPISQTKDEVRKVAFLAKKPKKVLVKSKYQLGDTVYVLRHNIADITTAQYIDFQNIAKSGEYDKNLELLMSVFLVPEGYSYGKGYDMVKAQNDILNYMDVETACSLSAFFLAKLRMSTRLLGRYLRKTLKKSKMLTEKEMEEAKKAIKNLTEASGLTDGFR